MLTGVKKVFKDLNSAYPLVVIHSSWKYCRVKMKLLIGLLALSVLFCVESWADDQQEDDLVLQPRVVNGNNAEKHEWPWQVFLMRQGRFICGGSIIKHDWIITAAHCVRTLPFPNYYTVTVGGHGRLGKKTKFQKTYKVKTLKYHRHYYRHHLRYDVALLQLDGSVKISKGVQMITLPRPGSKVPIGKICWVTGWGRLKGKGRLPSILQEAPIRIAPFRQCKYKNGRIVHDPTMICAGAQGKGACNGDSGGPLSCKEKGKWVLRGVTSWGIKGCLVNHYSVFARVSKFLNWIRTVTKSNNGCPNIKCHNGGIRYCVGKRARCRCKPYYNGRYCQKRLCPYTPCRHGKIRCINRFYSYCHCNRGYTGRYCGIRRTRCQWIPCNNGGKPRCLRFVYYSYCQCPRGFVGRYCECKKNWCR